MLEASQTIFLVGVSSVMDCSIWGNYAYLPCFKRFNSNALLMANYWNKDLTKATLVCVPIVIAGVVLKEIFEWLFMGVIL